MLNGPDVASYRKWDWPGMDGNAYTGKRTLWKELIPWDPAGVETVGPILITRDAKTCIFGYHRMLADLYLVDGMK